MWWWSLRLTSNNCTVREESSSCLGIRHLTSASVHDDPRARPSHWFGTRRIGDDSAGPSGTVGHGGRNPRVRVADRFSLGRQRDRGLHLIVHRRRTVRVQLLASCRNCNSRRLGSRGRTSRRSRGEDRARCRDRRRRALCRAILTPNVRYSLLALLCQLVPLTNAPAQRQPSHTIRWWEAAVAVGAVGLVSTFDHGVDGGVQDRRSTRSDAIARVFRHGGQPEVVFGFAGGVLAAGLADGRAV